METSVIKKIETTKEMILNCKLLMRGNLHYVIQPLGKLQGLYDPLLIKIFNETLIHKN